MSKDAKGHGSNGGGKKALPNRQAWELSERRGSHPRKEEGRAERLALIAKNKADREREAAIKVTSNKGQKTP